MVDGGRDGSRTLFSRCKRIVIPERTGYISWPNDMPVDRCGRGGLGCTADIVRSPVQHMGMVFFFQWHMARRKVWGRRQNSARVHVCGGSVCVWDTDFFCVMW